MGCFGSGGPARAGGAGAAEVEHGHRDERFRVTVTEGDPLEEPDHGALSLRKALRINPLVVVEFAYVFCLFQH